MKEAILYRLMDAICFYYLYLLTLINFKQKNDSAIILLERPKHQG